MKLKRPLNFLDCETTGLDLARDRIIELAVVQVRPNGEEKECCWRFHPGINIPPAVTRLHGLDEHKLMGYPRFAEKAAEILSFLNGGDLAGFNITNFDVPLLWEEFHRAGVEWNLTGVHLLDVGTIYRLRETRTLSNALKFYCRREHQKAHGALPDVHATMDILRAQIILYPDLPGKDVAGLSHCCQVDHRVDLAGMVVRDGDGHPCYNFAGIPFDRCTDTGLRIVDDPRLAALALSLPFPISTKQVLQTALSVASQQQLA